MQVTISKVTKYKISSGERMINVYTDDIEVGKGRIVIEFYGQSWSAYFGGCGNDSVLSFVLSCNNDYLLDSLIPAGRRWKNSRRVNLSNEALDLQDCVLPAIKLFLSHDNKAVNDE